MALNDELTDFRRGDEGVEGGAAEEVLMVVAWLSLAPSSSVVLEALKTIQDRGMALLVGADDFCQSERVEDFDQPSVGEATLMHGPGEGAKSAELLRVGRLGTNSAA